MTDRDEPELAPAEAARLLGISLATLGRYARNGQIRYRTLPSGHRRYRKSELEADLNTTPTQPTNPEQDTP